jgi:hypothetical protein
MVKVATPDKMRELRSKHSLFARGLSQLQMHAQMQRNGSVPRPNPWSRGLESMDGSSIQETSKH